MFESRAGKVKHANENSSKRNCQCAKFIPFLLFYGISSPLSSPPESIIPSPSPSSSSYLLKSMRTNSPLPLPFLPPSPPPPIPLCCFFKPSHRPPPFFEKKGESIAGYQFHRPKKRRENLGIQYMVVGWLTLSEIP